jgi:hypothetical protein
MAAKTPDSILRESVGSMTLFIATFSTNDIDDTDTWATGLGSNILGVWANGTDDPTQTKEGIDCAESAGTITFSTGEDNRTGKVFVLARA